MPELPEVETIRLKLHREIVGKKIKSVDVLEKKQFSGDPKTVMGKKVVDVRRAGKLLSIVLENKLFINIHLKLTGQILFAPNANQAIFKNTIPFTGTNKMPSKTTRIIINFSDNSGLFFNDMRKFGWMKISDKQEVPKAIDILSPAFTAEYLEKVIHPSKKPIKVLLMDQDKMAGIGNIYANEALFLAHIHPERKANSLSGTEIKNLYQAIKKVIEEGIKFKGSSAADEAYITPEGERGSMQQHFHVYQQEGKPCLKNCPGTVKRIKQAGRSSFYCPRCQK